MVYRDFLMESYRLSMEIVREKGAGETLIMAFMALS
jgi:hypothetical protein